MNLNDEKLLEKIANLEHEQWIFWAKSLIKTEKRLNEDRVFRWESLFVPYSELTESMKESDRVWARKVLELLK